MTYEVTVPCIAVNPYGHVEVEANSEKEAIAIVKRECRAGRMVLQYEIGAIDDTLWNEAEAQEAAK